MLTVLTIVLVLMAIAMIALILLQRGQGATAGAAFGAGASGTVFGARGASSFLTRATAFLALCVFGIALAMAVMISRGMGLADSEGLQIRSAEPRPDAVFDPNQPVTLEIPDTDETITVSTGDGDVPVITQQAESGDTDAAAGSDEPAPAGEENTASEDDQDGAN